MRFLCLFALMLSLLACSSLVPANTPLQLEATAGVPIIIDEEYIHAGRFMVDYPDGWRVVKLSLAGDPITMTFVAPDEREMWIEIAEAGGVSARPDVTLEPHLFERFDRVTNGDYILFAHGQSPLERREEFESIYQTVLASIRFP